MPKAIATYDPDPMFDYIVLGKRANVFCVEHSRNELCNRPVHTSVVVRILDDGYFETLNTLYKPV